jgi:hypothetical protein
VIEDVIYNVDIFFSVLVESGWLVDRHSGMSLLKLEISINSARWPGMIA